jgi:hypothetical protein
MIRLDPPIPLVTPKGEGYAHFVINNGQEHHLKWVVFIDNTGECWTFENPDVRLSHNPTMGRPKQTYQWRKCWDQVPKSEVPNGS